MAGAPKPGDPAPGEPLGPGGQLATGRRSFLRAAGGYDPSRLFRFPQAIS